MRHARADYQRRIQDSENLIPDDEPVFLLRGQDMAAIPALTSYIQHAMMRNFDPKLIEAAKAHRELMYDWQKRVKSKKADL